MLIFEYSNIWSLIFKIVNTFSNLSPYPEPGVSKNEAFCFTKRSYKMYMHTFKQQKHACTTQYLKCEKGFVLRLTKDMLYFVILFMHIKFESIA